MRAGLGRNWPGKTTARDQPHLDAMADVGWARPICADPEQAREGGESVIPVRWEDARNRPVNQGKIFGSERDGPRAVASALRMLAEITTDSRRREQTADGFGAPIDEVLRT